MSNFRNSKKKGRSTRPFFYFIPALFLVFLGVSCSQKDKNVLQFGYGHSFKLVKGEANAAVDSLFIKDYESLINHYPNLQIPVNKLVRAPRYDLVLAVCIDGNVKDLRKTISLDSAYKVYSNGSSWMAGRTSNRYILKLLHDNGNFPPYCISLVSRDSLLVDSVSTGKNNMLKRFSFNE